MRYREQNNMNNRNQGWVRSSLYRAQVGLFWVFGFFGSCKEGSKGLGNCRDASGNCLGSLGKLLWKSWEVSGSAWEPREGYGTFLSLVSNVLRVLRDVTVFPPQGPRPEVLRFRIQGSCQDTSETACLRKHQDTSGSMGTSRKVQGIFS